MLLSETKKKERGGREQPNQVKNMHAETRNTRKSRRITEDKGEAEEDKENGKLMKS